MNQSTSIDNTNGAAATEQSTDQSGNKGMERYLAYARNYSKIGKAHVKLRRLTPKIAPKNGKYFAQHSSEFGEIFGPLSSENLALLANGLFKF